MPGNPYLDWHDPSFGLVVDPESNTKACMHALGSDTEPSLPGQSSCSRMPHVTHKQRRCLAACLSRLNSRTERLANVQSQAWHFSI